MFESVKIKKKWFLPVVEKRYERREDKAKFEEKVEFIPINEHLESNFNAVLSNAIVFQQPVNAKLCLKNESKGIRIFR